MPVTVSHVLSATTPDNAAYEIKPSNWNSGHNITLAAAGSEISGAFSNANGLSFGLSAGQLTASYTVPTQSNQTEGKYAVGNTTGASSSITHDARSLSIQGTGGVSVGYSNGSLVISGATGGGGGAAQSIGVSTGGGTSGNTGTYSGQVVFAGGNNITLSVSSGAAGAQTITISGANLGGAQTGISSIAAGGTTQSVGMAQFSNANGVSFGLSTNGSTGTITASVAAQTNQSVGIYASSNTTGASSSSTVDARSLSVVGYGAISVGLSGGSLQISAPATALLAQLSAGISGGNTAGNTGTVAQGLIVFAGGANITLSGSSNGSSETISIIGGAGGGGGAGLSAGTQSVSTGTVVFSNSNNVTFGMSGSSRITGSYALNVSATGGTSVGLSGLTFQDSQGVSFGLSTGAGVGTITASVAAQTNQTIGVYASSQTTGQSSSNTLDARSMSFVGQGGVSVGLSGNSVLISGAAGGGAGFTAGMSNIGNSTGTSGMVTGQLVLAGGGNVKISGSTNGGSITLTISANPQVSHGMSTGGNTLGDAVTVSGRLVLAGGNNVTLSGSTAAGNQTITVSGPNMFQAGISGGNTSNTSGTVSNQLVLAGGNNVTLSGSTDANGMSVTVSAGAGAAGAINVTGANGSSVSASTLAFSNSNGMTLGVSTGANGATVTGSYTQAAQTNQSLGIYASSQTFGQSSSSTHDARSLTIYGSGGISVGWSNGSLGISGQTTVAQTNQTVGLYALGNTTQNSSSTLDARTLSFNALGAMTMGYSNGSIQVSAPGTSSLVGVGGISISSNGSTISISEAPISRLFHPPGQLTAISAPGNASATLQYVPVLQPVTLSRLDALVSWAGASSATTNTCAFAVSAYAAIYTKNGATLSSVSSGSTQTTYSYASNSAGQTQLISGAIRPISVPLAANMTPGEYYVGFNIVTATSSIGLSTTNLAQSLSIMGGNGLQTAANFAEFTNQTATSTGLQGGMGVYSAATTGLPAAVSLSAINQTGAALSQANIALAFRNQ